MMTTTTTSDTPDSIVVGGKKMVWRKEYYDATSYLFFENENDTGVHEWFFVNTHHARDRVLDAQPPNKFLPTSWPGHLRVDTFTYSQTKQYIYDYIMSDCSAVFFTTRNRDPEQFLWISDHLNELADFHHRYKDLPSGKYTERDDGWINTIMDMFTENNELHIAMNTNFIDVVIRKQNDDLFIIASYNRGVEGKRD